jgi:hypothetical protein
LYGAELRALSLNGIEGCHEVHPPSEARVDEASIPRDNEKRKIFHQLTSMDEMFPSHGMRDNLLEFFLMDVILNRRIVPPTEQQCRQT